MLPPTPPTPLALLPAPTLLTLLASLSPQQRTQRLMRPRCNGSRVSILSGSLPASAHDRATQRTSLRDAGPVSQPACAACLGGYQHVVTRGALGMLRDERTPALCTTSPLSNDSSGYPCTFGAINPLFSSQPPVSQIVGRDTKGADDPGPFAQWAARADDRFFGRVLPQKVDACRATARWRRYSESRWSGAGITNVCSPITT